MPKLFVLLTLVLLAGHYQVHSQNDQSNNNSEKERPNQNVTITDTLRVSVEADKETIESEIAYKDRQEKRDQTNATWNRIGIVVNSLLFVLVLIQAYISHRQLNSMDASLEHAKATFIIAERAYIGIKHIKLAAPLEVGKEIPDLHIHFLNGGRTPAWKFRAYVSPSVHETWPTLKDVNSERPQADRGSFMPAGTVDLVKFNLSTTVIRKVDITKIILGQLKLVVSVKAIYDDLQGNSHYLNELYGLTAGEFGELVSLIDAESFPAATQD